MNTKAGPSTPFSRDVTLFPERTARLLRLEVLLQVVGLVAAVVRHGLTPRAGNEHLELGVVVLLAMGGLTVSMAMRHHWSLAKHHDFVLRFLRDGKWQWMDSKEYLDSASH